MHTGTHGTRGANLGGEGPRGWQPAEAVIPALAWASKGRKARDLEKAEATLEACVGAKATAGGQAD